MMTEITIESLFARTIRRRLSRTILIKDSAAYERLHRELQDALTRAWDDAMRDGIINALDRLRDLGPGQFTRDDATSILSALEERVGRDAIQAAMRRPVINLTDALFRTGAVEVGSAAGIDIAFRRPDLAALDVLKDNNLFWIGESWNSHTKDKLDRALTEFFTDGMTREGLAQRMADEFRTLTSRSHVYWEAVADHMATKTREIGRITGYEQAGMEYVQIRAHLDDRTTPVCRQLHGRVIAVPSLAAQRDAYFEASKRGNKLAMERIWPMHGKDADFSNTPTGLLQGVGSPPYHFRCRTITVGYWATSAEIAELNGEADPSAGLDGWTRRTYDREPLSRKQVGALIDRAKTAEWPHTKVVRGHYRKHQARLGLESQSDFSQSAIDLIRRGNRDVYTSVRKGVLNATFVRPAANAQTGQPGFIVTAVDLAENKITSHHWRKNLETSKDEVPALKQPGRGIMKWLTDFLA